MAKIFLNIGSGDSSPERLPAVFKNNDWQETRIDINPAVQPDVVSCSTNLADIPDQHADAIWSSHSLEHLAIHQVPLALTEMYRVLKNDGFALITLPDLQAVAQLVVDGQLTETAYTSPVGPIRALDMLFGHAPSVAAGQHHMAHRCGFDARFLANSLLAAGFVEVRVRKGDCYDLWAYAVKQVAS